MSSVWYGSVNNRLEEHGNHPEPVVGMGVTEMYWSDREPYEITKVIDDRHILVRRLDAKVKDGCVWPDLHYDYFSDKSACEIKLFKTKKGVWRERYPEAV